MSKMDDLRAMREARFERTSSAQPRPPARVRPPATAVTPVAEVPPAEVGVPAADALCGHRNIGGRTCTRERGHAAKSHRYS